MKKFLIILGVLLIGTCSFAEDVYLLKGVNLDNYWKKKGIDEEKVLTVGQKIMIDNKITKRAPIFVINDKKTLNAYSNIYIHHYFYIWIMILSLHSSYHTK